MGDDYHEDSADDRVIRPLRRPSEVARRRESSRERATATMFAPASAGTYGYSVWTDQGPTDGTGQVGSKVYTITVHVNELRQERDEARQPVRDLWASVPTDTKIQIFEKSEGPMHKLKHHPFAPA